LFKVYGLLFGKTNVFDRILDTLLGLTSTEDKALKLQMEAQKKHEINTMKTMGCRILNDVRFF
jgi:predicted acetyltransferase